jgi:poly(A) polymerase
MFFRLLESRTDYQFATSIVARLQEAGHLAYFAGGCVRDQLLEQIPQDYDVATSARPEQVRELFGDRATQLVGAAFGVVCIHGRRDGQRHQVEVATFRNDGNYSDGRRPDSVVFSTPPEDAQRRDFTINGIFWDPVARQVYDFVGGQEDLKQQVLRAIGNPRLRFTEDKLRLLRAVRFAARFGFPIEPTTRSAITELADTLGQVSRERISQEMHKVFDGPRRSHAIQMLWDLNLWRSILPPLADQWHIDKTARDWTTRWIDLDACQSFLPATVALFAPLLWPPTCETVRPCLTPEMESPETVSSSLKSHWKISNEEAADLRSILATGRALVVDADLPWSQVQPWLVLPRASMALRLICQWRLLHGIPTDSIDALLERMQTPVEHWNPVPLIDGRVLQDLKVPSGPVRGKLLAEVRARQLDGKLNSREEAIAWLKDHASKFDSQKPG